MSALDGKILHDQENSLKIKREMEHKSDYEKSLARYNVLCKKLIKIKPIINFSLSDKEQIFRVYATLVLNNGAEYGIIVEADENGYSLYEHTTINRDKNKSLSHLQGKDKNIKEILDNIATLLGYYYPNLAAKIDEILQIEEP